MKRKSAAALPLQLMREAADGLPDRLPHRELPQIGAQAAIIFPLQRHA
jgi:hypothetical protein